MPTRCTKPSENTKKYNDPRGRICKVLTSDSEFRACDTGALNDMLALTERSEVRDSGTGLLNDMIFLAERSEVRKIGTGLLNERQRV